MGWFQRLMGTMKNAPKEAQPIHIYDLAEWLNSQAQEIIIQHNLNEEAQRYATAIKEKRWQLERNLDSWQQERPANEQTRTAFSETKKILELLAIPQNLSVSAVLMRYYRLESQLNKVIKLLENSGENSAPEGAHSSDDIKKAKVMVQELQGIHQLQEQFEEKIIESGFSKVYTILQRSTSIEDCTDQIRHLCEELQRRKEHLALLEAKKAEKQLELKALQEHSLYPNFNAIKDQRAALMTELERSGIALRFELRQQVDQLEKSIGSKDFLLKIDETNYRLDHFSLQCEKTRQELARIEDDLTAQHVKQEREIELVANLVKLSLNKEIKIKT